MIITAGPQAQAKYYSSTGPLNDHCIAGSSPDASSLAASGGRRVQLRCHWWSFGLSDRSWCEVGVGVPLAVSMPVGSGLVWCWCDGSCAPRSYVEEAVMDCGIRICMVNSTGGKVVR